MRTMSILKPLFFLILIGVALGFLALPNAVPSTIPITDPRLNEASGLAISHRHPGIIYTHNDSGNPAEIYALTTKGELRSLLKLSGVKNRDWEDIATLKGNKDHPAYIYVGETGDNNARWESVFVYRFPEPEKLDKAVEIDNTEKYEISYEDGPRDAEALFVDPRSLDIYIITKREKQVGVYRVAYPQSTLKVNPAVKIATFPLTWVTAADISPDGSQILIKTYTEVYSLKRGKTKDLAKVFKRKLSYRPYVIEPQGEAVCFDAKGKGRFTLSERNGDNPQYLYYYK